jgi:O-antigen ligase
MSGMKKESVFSLAFQRCGFHKLILLSVLSLIITSPFFLYKLFERPSLSQIYYLTGTGLALIPLFSFYAFFVPGRLFDREFFFRIFPGLIFILSLLLSVVLSSTPAFSFKELLFTISCAGIFIYVIISRLDNKDAGKILYAFIFVACIAALYGIAQNYGFEILGYSAEEKKGKLNVISVFGHPNYLAAYLAPVIMILVNDYLEKPGIFRRILLSCPIAIILLCLLLAGTRGAWLSLVFSLPSLIFFRKMASKKSMPLKSVAISVIVSFLLVLILIFIFLPMIAPSYDLKKRMGDRMPLLSRFFSWRMAGEMMKSHPVSGVGFGRYKVLYWSYVDDFQKKEENRIYDYLHNYGLGVPPVNVHNEFLEIAAESGIIGFSAFIFFLSMLFSGSFRILDKCRDIKKSPGAIPGILAAIVCILVDSLFNFPLHQPLSAFLFWMLCALIFVRIDFNSVKK